MIVLMNWWAPYSKASITSAINLGHRVCVIVSDSDNEGEGFLNDYHVTEDINKLKQRDYNQIILIRDSEPRNSKAAHTLTRFDYLPEVLSRVIEPVLVTDADVIFQRKLDIPSVHDIALWWPDARPWNEVEDYARHHAFPLWWSELANTIYAEAMYFSGTAMALDFANRIKVYVDSLRADGYGDRWGVDQVAIACAARRLPKKYICPLNAGQPDVATSPDAAIWFPHPHERDNLQSAWNQARANLLNSPKGDRQ